MKKYIIYIAAVLSSFFPTISYAGNPFLFESSLDRSAVIWEDSTIVWYATKNDLSSLVSNDDAVAAIEELFGTWQNATLTTADGSEIKAVDLNVEFGGVVELGDEDPYVLSRKLGGPLVIFDDDGSRVEDEFGEGSQKYVVGYAAPLINGSSNFVGGVIVLNGLFVDGDTEKVMEVEFDEFKAAMLHEIGHLLNIDHTQANIEAIDEIRAGDESLIDDIPTMYPILYSASQLTLSSDDIISIAQNYPSEDFIDNFCTIIGGVVDADGNGLQGVDVVARSSGSDHWSDVRTYVSGVKYSKGTANGTYVLSGIVPNKNYDVYYHGIDEDFTGGSGFAPLDPPLSGVIPGVIVENRVLCSVGGQVVDTTASAEAVVAIDPANDNSLQVNENVGAGASAAGCSLIR